jgi:hypothetical protein
MSSQSNMKQERNKNNKLIFGGAFEGVNLDCFDEGLKAMRNFFCRALQSSFLIVLPMYLSVLRVMYSVMAGICRKRFLTSSLFILSSLTHFMDIIRGCIGSIGDGRRLVSFGLV